MATQKQLLDFLRKETEKTLALAEAKNDYAGENSDAFANFVLGTKYGLGPAEQGFLWRMADKFSRICNLLGRNTKAKVKTESVKDTLRDLSNYCLLLLAYLEFQEQEEEEEEEEVMVLKRGRPCKKK